MNRILCALLLICMSCSLAVGCSNKKEGTENIKQTNGLEKERLDNQAEITSNIAEIVTTQLPENMLRAGVVESPELQLKDAKVDENIFTVSYNSATGVELALSLIHI